MMLRSIRRTAAEGRRAASSLSAAAAAAQAAPASQLIRMFAENQPLQWHGAGCRCPMHRANSTSAASSSQGDYAFEMAASSIRFGTGCTAEVGMDIVNLRARRVMVFSDKHIAAIRNGPLTKVLAALHKEQREGRIDDVFVFDEVQVEPTDKSFAAAVAAAKAFGPDAYIAVGGGSVMDTAKAANLYESHRDADFLDFVNAPIGAYRLRRCWARRSERLWGY